MKTGEEPSPDSPRGNPSAHRPMTGSAETKGSLPRSGRTAAAPSEQPSPRLFPEMMMDVLVHRELESGGPLVRNESRHRAEGSCGILPQRFIALVPIPKGSPGGAVEATARPSVSARGTALGSVLTGALSSAHVTSQCTSDGNVR